MTILVSPSHNFFTLSLICGVFFANLTTEAGGSVEWLTSAKENVSKHIYKTFGLVFFKAVDSNLTQNGFK